MRNHLFKIKILTIIFILSYFIVSNLNGQQLGLFSVRGKTDLKSIKELKLYKYKSVFELEFITNIEIENNSFYYVANLLEPDMYLLENSSDKKFIIFVWDSNIEINIDTPDISKAKVLNSPLNLEKEAYDTYVQSQFFEPIRKIDTLILNLKKINSFENKRKVDSLNQEKNLKIDWSKKEFKNFNKNYIIENNNSFNSLFILTYTGHEPSKEENRILFNKLSSKLKSHSRGLIYGL